MRTKETRWAGLRNLTQQKGKEQGTINDHGGKKKVTDSEDSRRYATYLLLN